jgi:hypothetical protein
MMRFAVGSLPALIIKEHSHVEAIYPPDVSPLDGRCRRGVAAGVFGSHRARGRE